MALNPYFLQGSSTEQNLVQSLINEQIKMYGVDVYYIPRRYMTKATVIQEVIESKFEEAIPLWEEIMSWKYSTTFWHSISLN